MLKVFVGQQRTPISLNDSNYLGMGKEATTYASGNTVYKIFTDPKDITPIEKIKELQVLKHESIIKPDELVYSSNAQKSNVVGFTMRKVSGTFFPEIFNSDFWKEKRINKNVALDLCENLKRVLSFIHSFKGILVIDLNEFNILADKTSFKTPYIIDVNSFQTPSYKATFVMETIIDYHARIFSELTDWFAFAIISFQIFLGIHPFRGKHSKFTTLKERMQNNISILNSEVKYPKIAVRPFSNIPENYFEWYRGIFEDGLRMKPPDTPGKFLSDGPVPQRSQYVILKEFDSNIIWVEGEQVRTENSFYLGNVQYQLRDTLMDNIFVTSSGIPIYTSITNGMISFENLKTKKNIPIKLKCDELMVVDGVPYIFSNQNVTELGVHDFSGNIILSVKNAWRLPNVYKTLNGAILQDVFGKFHLMIPESGLKSKFHNLQIKELEGYRIINGKRKKNVVMINGQGRNGKNDKFILIFDDDFKSYLIELFEDVSSLDLNFEINNGEVVVIVDNLMKRIGGNGIISSDCKHSFNLVKIGDEVCGFVGNKIYKLS